MKKTLLALLISLPIIALADTSPDLSIKETEFIDKVYGIEKSKILAQFGKPSRSGDIKSEEDKVIASIWLYHNINTNDQGQYYPTTEIDFVYDKVSTVVFMNSDGEDALKNTDNSTSPNTK